jgi:hypothetical protein
LTVDGLTVEGNAPGVTSDAAKRKAAERARRYRERKKKPRTGFDFFLMPARPLSGPCN